MDSKRFDSWTRTRATSANRRTVLGWSLTAGLAAAMTRLQPAKAQFGGGGSGSCTYQVTLTSSFDPSTSVSGALVIDIHNRATAGSGYPGTGYEARYNIIVREPAPDSWQPYSGSFAIDMHDYLQIQQDRGYRVAGDVLNIHHNTFVNNASSDPSVLTSNDAGVRGVPRVLAEFHQNIFLQSDPMQSLFHLGGNVWIYDNLYGPQQTLIPIAPHTTPQILFVQPPPQDVDIPLLAGEIPLDFKVNMLDTLTLKRVIVELNGDTIYSGVKAPTPGEVKINTSTLDPSLPFQALTVKATDSRNVTGEHTTVFRIQ